jgi:hypothetical protein
VTTGILRYTAHHRGGERQHTRSRPDLVRERAGEAGWGDGVGEHQIADLLHGRLTGAAVAGSRDAGVDQDRIEDSAAEGGRKGVERCGIVHVEPRYLHLSGMRCFQFVQGDRLRWITGGRDHIPTMCQERLRDAEADAACGADDQRQPILSHLAKSFRYRVARRSRAGEGRRPPRTLKRFQPDGNQRPNQGS